MELMYRGTAYHGWQIQPNALTVQQVVQEALKHLLSEPVSITGSGRTDTGVHARQQVAHFDVPSDLDVKALCFRLNAMLPTDISITQIYAVPTEAHARFDAQSRSYEYHLHTFKDPFATDQSYHFRHPLHLESMNEAAQQLVAYGEQDYQCFSRSRTQQNHFRCRISRAQWVRCEDPRGLRLLFRITADRFLRGMVRAVVGTMLDVGTGRTSLEEFRDIVASQDRQRAGRSVPAHGLYLTEVTYGEKDTGC